MIKDVIGAGTCNAHVHPIKRHPLKQRTVESVPQSHVTDLIVVTRSSVEEVHTHLRRVDTQVELLAQTVLTEADVLDVEGLA